MTWWKNSDEISCGDFYATYYTLSVKLGLAQVITSASLYCVSSRICVNCVQIN